MANKPATIKERVLTIAKEKKISFEKFCEGIGMSYSSFKGPQKSSSLNSDAIDKIITKYPDVDVHWLITGTENPVLAVDQPVYQYGKRRFIPLIPTISLTEFIENQAHLEEIATASYSMPLFEENGVEFLVRVQDAAMTPLYLPGDLIGCKTIPDLQFIQWGKVHLVTTDQGLILRRLFPDFKQKGAVEFRSESPEAFPTFSVSLDSIQNASLVLGYVRM